MCFGSRGECLYLWVQPMDNKYPESTLSTHILLLFEFSGVWPGKIQFAITNQELIHLNCIICLAVPCTWNSVEESSCRLEIPSSPLQPGLEAPSLPQFPSLPLPAGQRRHRKSHWATGLSPGHRPRGALPTNPPSACVGHAVLCCSPVR